MLPIKEVVTFNELRNEYWEISRLKEVIINIKVSYLPLLKEGKMPIISLDCYDLLDWLFPPGITFHDSHYLPVHNLWRTVEDNLGEHSNIKLCIPPPSALEMFHILKEKMIDDNAEILPTDDNYNYKDYSKKIIKKYSSIKRITESLTNYKYVDHLIRLLNNKKIITYDSIIKTSNIDRIEYDRIVGKYIDFDKGKSYLVSKKNEMRSGVNDTFSDISAESDLFNLMDNVFVNEQLLKTDDKFVIMTSHGLFTLHSWKISMKAKTQFKQSEHSLVALLLTKTLKNIGDLHNFEKFIEELIFLCDRYIGDLERYPQIYSYFHEEKKYQANDKINMNDSTMTKISYWQDEIDSNISCTDYSNECNYSIFKEEDAFNYFMNKRNIQNDRTLIKEKSQDIADKTHLISADMRNLLLPSNLETDEILVWLYGDR